MFPIPKREIKDKEGSFHLRNKNIIFRVVGKMKPVRPELAKFRQFEIILKVWAIFWTAYLVFDKRLYQLWYFYAVGQIFIVVNGQRLNRIITIWSHCSSFLVVRYFVINGNCLFVKMIQRKEDVIRYLFDDWFNIGKRSIIHEVIYYGHEHDEAIIYLDHFEPFLLN